MTDSPVQSVRLSNLQNNCGLLELNPDILLFKVWPEGKFLIGHRVSKFLHTMMKKGPVLRLLFVRAVDSMPLAQAWIQSLEGGVQLMFPEQQYKLQRGARLDALKLSLHALTDAQLSGTGWRGPCLLSFKDCHMGDEISSSSMLQQVTDALRFGNSALSSLIHLDMTGNRLRSRHLNRMLGKLHDTAPSLTHLSLASNRMGYPFESNELLQCFQSLGNMTALRELVLARNMLGNDGASILASGLSRCHSIVHLDISYNDISGPGLGHVFQGLSQGILQVGGSLQYFDVSGNAVASEGAERLAEFAAAGGFSCTCDLRMGQTYVGRNGGCDALCAALLCICTQDRNHHDHTGASMCKGGLNSLEISHDDFGADGARTLCETLGMCTSLQLLSLPSGLRLGKGGPPLLASSLLTCTSLTELTLSGVRLGKVGAENLGNALRTMRALQSLKLGGTGIGDEGCRHVASALGAACLMLTCLDVGEEDLTHLGAEHLRAGLGPSCTQLTDLCLCKNTKMSQQAAYSLAALSSARLYTRLDVRNCPLGSKGVCAMLSACSGGRLEYLNMSETTANRTDEMKELCQSLGAQSMWNLCFLDVSVNSLCLQTLAESLQQLTSLQLLNISSIGAGGDIQGMLQIAHSLSHCKSLSHLMVGENNCGPDSAQYLTAMMRCCPALTHLCMGDNGLGCGGAAEVASCISEGCLEGLIKLDLSDNDFTEQGAEKVARELCR